MPSGRHRFVAVVPITTSSGRADDGGRRGNLSLSVCSAVFIGVHCTVFLIVFVLIAVVKVNKDICISWHDGSTAVYRSGTVIYHNNLCGTMVVP